MARFPLYDFWSRVPSLCPELDVDGWSESKRGEKRGEKDKGKEERWGTRNGSEDISRGFLVHIGETDRVFEIATCPRSPRVSTDIGKRHMAEGNSCHSPLGRRDDDFHVSCSDDARDTTSHRRGCCFYSSIHVASFRLEIRRGMYGFISLEYIIGKTII